MKPIYFHKDNHLVTAKGMNELPISYMQTTDERRVIVSCWQPTLKERIQLLFKRPIYLAVMSNRQPPVLLTIDKTQVGLD